MTNELSERVKQLIAKAKIVSFDSWQATYPQVVIEICQKADDEGRYLTNGELEQIQTLVPETATLVKIAQLLRDRASEIVDEAREKVLGEFPDITKPGGGLYPAKRAENCWRDFWHFLRCITYGIAGSNTQYTSAEGMHYMELLYQELRVPLDAMVVGLESVKAASIARVTPGEGDAIGPYFDHLINQLRQFQTA
ncbi:MAG: phycobilisome protein [Hormoscilla sp.]